jgi:hypothetical protein
METSDVRKQQGHGRPWWTVGRLAGVAVLATAALLAARSTPAQPHTTGVPNIDPRARYSFNTTRFFDVSTLGGGFFPLNLPNLPNTVTVIEHVSVRFTLPGGQQAFCYLNYNPAGPIAAAEHAIDTAPVPGEYTLIGPTSYVQGSQDTRLYATGATAKFTWARTGGGAVPDQSVVSISGYSTGIQ